MHILRVATVYDPDVNAFPDEFRSVLTDQDVQAIQTGPEFFATSARADSPKWLRKLLAVCREARVRATVPFLRRCALPALLPIPLSG